MAKDFADLGFQPHGSFDDLGFKDAVSGSQSAKPRQAADLGEALLTNLPVQGVAQNLVRGLPGALGGLVGGIAGLPGGPAGVIAGAGLGGAAGEAARQAVSQGTAAAFPEANYPVAGAGRVLNEVGGQAAAQAGGTALGLGAGAAATALRPGATQLGAQGIRVLSGVPAKTAEMALRNPGMLLDAPSAEASRAAYIAFEAKTGLKGLGSSIAEAGRFPGESELEAYVFEAAKKATTGNATPQELYTASQAASSLNQLGKLGNPRYAMLKSAIGQAKSTVDDALEIPYPSYKDLRSGYAATKAAGQFFSLLPLNQNQSPNVLRTTAAGAAVAGGLMSGNPAALAALPLISPRVYGIAIKGMALAGRIPAGVYQAGLQTVAGSAGSPLADAYAQQRAP